MTNNLTRLSAEKLAEIHAAASDLNELIEKEAAVDSRLRFLLSGLIFDVEEALAKVDPLVDRQPVIVVTEALAVQ